MNQKRVKQYNKILKNNYNFLIDGIDEDFLLKMDLVFEQTNSLESVINSISLENKEYIIERANQKINIKRYDGKNKENENYKKVIKFVVYEYFKSNVISQILETVSKVFKIEKEYIKSKIRLRELVEARYTFMYLLRKYNEFLTYKEIASNIHSGYDHSSVIYGVDNISYYLEKKENFKFFHSKYEKADNSISKIFNN